MKKLTDILVNLQNSPITEASFNDMPVPFPNEDRVSVALNHLSQIGEMVDDLYNTLSNLEEIDNAIALALTSAYNRVDDLYAAVEETYGIEPVEDFGDEEMDESYELDESVWDTFDKKNNKMAPADSANIVPPKLKSLGFKAAEPGKDTWMPTKGNVVQLFGIPMRAGKWADVFFAVTDDAKPYTVITDDGVTKFKNERDAITYMMAGDMTEDLEEALSPDAPAGEWIDDFIKSDAPQFKGKSKKERIKMALGAYYGAQKKESTDLELEEAKMSPQQKNDAQRVQYGAMSKDDYNKKYKLGKYKAAGNPLAGPGGLYKNLVKRPMGEDLEEGVFFPKYPKDATVDDKIRIAKTFIASTKQAIAKDEKDIEGARGVDGMIQWSKIKGVGASLSDNKANLAAAEKRLARLEKEKANK